MCLSSFPCVDCTVVCVLTLHLGRAGLGGSVLSIQRGESDRGWWSMVQSVYSSVYQSCIDLRNGSQQYNDSH